MVKVRMFCDWDKTSSQLIEDLQRQTLGFIGNRYDEFEFVSDDDYDHAVVFNFPLFKPKTPESANLGLLLEPPEILNVMYPNWVGKRNVPGIGIFYSFCSGTPFPSVTAYGMGFATVKPILVPDLGPRKRACMIASNKRFTPWHDKRHEVLAALLDSDLPIDFYGRGMVGDDERIIGEIAPGQKQPVLSQYSYCIDFENSSHGAVTDKYFDPVLSGTMPITNATVLQDIAPIGSYRLVDFNLEPAQIVEQIRSEIAYAPSFINKTDIREAAAQIVSGKLSITKWIVERLREIRS